MAEQYRGNGGPDGTNGAGHSDGDGDGTTAPATAASAGRASAR